jgi:hypothetical protein
MVGHKKAEVAEITGCKKHSCSPLFLRVLSLACNLSLVFKNELNFSCEGIIPDIKERLVSILESIPASCSGIIVNLLHKLSRGQQ